ncbi:MAG: sulfonate transport system substrate-binding protein [Eubacteriales bacterium]|nr:sulfonate transport system substrate-binding protein [Eubacteriales bacterium]
MRKGRSWLAGLLLVFFFFSQVFSTGCGKKDTKVLRIRVGFFPNVTHSVPIVGLEKGIFQKHLGKEAVVETRIFTAGPALMEALNAGEVDIGYVGPVPVVNSYAQGSDVKVVAGACNGGSLLVYRLGSGIRQVRDLAGKRVGVPQLANTQDLLLRHVLEEAGLKDSNRGGTVQIVQVTPADLYPLFRRGEVDAALVAEPWGSWLKEKGIAGILLDWKSIWAEGRYPTTVVAVRGDFYRQNSSLVDRWLAGHRETVEFITASREEAGDILVQALKRLTGQEMDKKTILNTLQTCQPVWEVKEEFIEAFACLAYRNGYLRGMPDLQGLLAKR